ncbi:MAG: hypothetical protein AB1716_10000 [Planctomycetota bacterium]
MRVSQRRVALIVLALAGLTTAPVFAGIIGPLVIIEAQNEGGTGQVVVAPNASWYEPTTGTWTWRLAESTEIRDPESHELIGTLNEADVRFVDDPVLTLAFSVTAGDQATTFSIKTALLVISPPLTSAQGQASAAVVATDTDGTGVNLRGLGGVGGDKVYLAHYNGFVPNGTPFAELLTTLSAGAYGSAAGSSNVPLTPIAGTVNDMSSMLHFELSARDLASGTTVYEVVPEPAALAVMVLLGWLVRRR